MRTNDEEAQMNDLRSMKKLTFPEFCQAFNLGPFVPFRRAGKVDVSGTTRMYELVQAGKLTIIKNGNRSLIPAQQLYDRYLQRLEELENSRDVSNIRAVASGNRSRNRMLACSEARQPSQKRPEWRGRHTIGS
jgi:hypothetical protein